MRWIVLTGASSSKHLRQARPDACTSVESGLWSMRLVAQQAANLLSRKSGRRACVRPAHSARPHHAQQRKPGRQLPQSARGQHHTPKLREAHTAWRSREDGRPPSDLARSQGHPRSRPAVQPPTRSGLVGRCDCASHTGHESEPAHPTRPEPGYPRNPLATKQISNHRAKQKFDLRSQVKPDRNICGLRQSNLHQPSRLKHGTNISSQR